MRGQRHCRETETGDIGRSVLWSRNSRQEAERTCGYYERMATRHRAATLMSDGALQTLKLGMAMGMGERFVPEMADIVLALNEPQKARAPKG